MFPEVEIQQLELNLGLVNTNYAFVFWQSVAGRGERGAIIDEIKQTNISFLPPPPDTTWQGYTLLIGTPQTQSRRNGKVTLDLPWLHQVDLLLNS